MAEQDAKIKLDKIVQLPLIDSDMEAITNLEAKPVDVMKGLQQMLDIGWCYEHMLDKRDGGYTVLCKMSRKGHVNQGKGFYAKGDTLYASMVCALYKMQLAGTEDINFLYERRKVVKSFS